MIQRTLFASIHRACRQGKVIIIYGPRQVGKTTLVKELLTQETTDSLYLHAEIPRVSDLLSSMDPDMIAQGIGLEKRLIVIDEAQTIPHIGRLLKILIDTRGDTRQIIVTGSSSFALADVATEPLTGRHISFFLPPLSLSECGRTDAASLASNAPLVMRYGMYPEVMTRDIEHKRPLLSQLSSDYLYKDILLFEGIKKSRLLEQLVSLLAWQIGSEVSLSELANKLGVSRPTIENYITILEQAFVIIHLHAYARNKRNEIVKSRKIYFRDIGIRNAAIGVSSPLSHRNDSGALWENMCVIELIKAGRYDYRQVSFWRNYHGAEVDIIIDHGDHIIAYECKRNHRKAKTHPPKHFQELYPDAEYRCLTPLTLGTEVQQISTTVREW